MCGITHTSTSACALFVTSVRGLNRGEGIVRAILSKSRCVAPSAFTSVVVHCTRNSSCVQLQAPQCVSPSVQCGSLKPCAVHLSHQRSSVGCLASAVPSHSPLAVIPSSDAEPCAPHCYCDEIICFLPTVGHIVRGKAGSLSDAKKRAMSVEQDQRGAGRQVARDKKEAFASMRQTVG